MKKITKKYLVTKKEPDDTEARILGFAHSQKLASSFVNSDSRHRDDFQMIAVGKITTIACIYGMKIVRYQIIEINQLPIIRDK